MSGHSLCLKPGLRRTLLPSKKKKTQTNQKPSRRQDIFCFIICYIIFFSNLYCRNLVLFFLQNTYWCVCVNVCSNVFFLFSFFFSPFRSKQAEHRRQMRRRMTSLRCTGFLLLLLYACCTYDSIMITRGAFVRRLMYHSIIIIIVEHYG